jgi:flagellar protein FlgJ
MQVKGNQYIYSDISGLNDLKVQARTNQKMALKDVAKQFESLFMNMMLKSMRDASMGDPIFDSNQSGMYRDMFDRQLALSLSKGQGMGLAEVLERQLSQQIPGLRDTQASAKSKTGMTQVAYQPDHISRRDISGLINGQLLERKFLPRSVDSIDLSKDISSPQEKFIRELWPMADAAADELDTLPEVLISQAALETGWGKHVTTDAKGNSSFNLFNIKAGADWDGKTIEKTTIEFHNGIPVKEVARFRAYDSYAESFNDYVNFLKTSGRYDSALQNAADPEKFIRGLHHAGYATDPAYADKVLNIINREWDVINKTISLYEGMEQNV